MIELLEHNKPTYADLCEKMEKNNKVALVQATGTGKSYIIGKYLEEHKGKTLILVPTNAIGDQWENLMAKTDCDVTIDTYQGMAAHIEDESGYDIVIADEMHHLGSDVWGTAFINLFMQNTTQKVIGTTATEIRYLDNSRDMVEELFNGVAARGCDLRTAIENGILPLFTYVSVWYGNDKDYEEYAKKAEKIKDNDVRERTIGKLELCKQNQKSIEQAIEENLSDEPHKIVVFMNSINSMDKVEKKIKKAFSADKTYKINSLMKKAQIRKNIDGFSTSENGNTVLFAIDMLNEGVHIDGVDTVAFFRTTESPAIYFQQLGRCLAVSKVDKKRTVFDFVCNSSNIHSLVSDEDENNGFIGNLNKKLPKEKKIIIKSYTKNLNDLFSEINDYVSLSFTDDEVDFIRNNTNLNATEMGKALNRSTQAVINISKRLNIKISNARKRYSEEEISLLYDKELSSYEISKMTGRSHQSIKAKRQSLGIKITRVNDIMELYKRYDEVDIAKKLGISQQYVHQILVKKGLKEKSFVRKTQKRGIKQVTYEDEKYIIQHANNTVEEIARKLGLTRSAVTEVRKKHGIERKSRQYLYNGCSLTVTQWSEKTGISSTLIRQRLRNGWSIERALGYR